MLQRITNIVTCAAIAVAVCFTVTQARAQTEHGVVSYESGKFDAWPANNGLWTWDDGREVLVGFVRGGYAVKAGHGIVEPYDCLLARTTDAGQTWTVERPDNFVGRCGEAVALDAPIDFSADNFAMRVVGDAYHGSTRPDAEFFYSTDRGKTWRGPFLFADLNDDPRLDGMILTPRTDVIPLGASSCLLGFSARPKGGGLGDDRAFMLRTDDGGVHWRIVNWIIGPDDPARAVMPATVQLSDGSLVTALRRRQTDQDKNTRCWIDVCRSSDEGQTWPRPIFVGDTGDQNGNPPAMSLLDDGRLAIVYANRSTRQILTHLSSDQGQTWSDPIELRADYQADDSQFSDMGYCRLFQRPDGKLVAIYYWATADNPEPHIERTIWQP
ncbi:MAG: exo-alpha-sialidase [Phycisphaeraceae bacterium]|nr:exo-alpha-sialidase [Phycisphaeraceae bacterium]